jgi:hypothetical protein
LFVDQTEREHAAVFFIAGAAVGLISSRSTTATEEAVIQDEGCAEVMDLVDATTPIVATSTAAATVSAAAVAVTAAISSGAEVKQVGSRKRYSEDYDYEDNPFMAAIVKKVRYAAVL